MNIQYANLIFLMKQLCFWVGFLIVFPFFIVERSLWLESFYVVEVGSVGFEKFIFSFL